MRAMPFFDDFYAGKLRGALGVADAQAVLDLRGAKLPQAQASLDALIERSRFGAESSVAVRIDPPAEGGGETLFQPVGRTLLQARRKGLIARLHPLPAHDGLGFYVVFTGKAAAG
jgi:DNA-nicking Smr family endonuclease